MTPREILPRLVLALRDALPGATAIYVFGSVARADGGPGSDIDLAVLLDRRLAADERWVLQERLAVMAGRDVDLVDLRAASAVLRAQVLADGEVLFEADRTARALFEATALADYARLNEERRGILEDVRRRGRVHG